MIAQLDANRTGHLTGHELNDAAGLLIGWFRHHQYRGRIQRIDLLQELNEFRSEAVVGTERNERHEVVHYKPCRPVLANQGNKVPQRTGNTIVTHALQIQKRRYPHQADIAGLVGLFQVETDRGGLDHEIFVTVGRNEQGRLSQRRPGVRKHEGQQTSTAGRATVYQIRATAVETPPRVVDHINPE